MAGGRKLEFDKQQALDAAMQIFWEKGYAGASLSDLTQGMGINKPSMYATFGNKEALFMQAIEHYVENYAKLHEQYLTAPNTSLKRRLKNYLMSVIVGQCEEEKPKGCYISLCVSEAASESMPDKALQLINKVGNFALILLTEFFEQDGEARKLNLGTSAEQKALFIVSMLHGTAAMARAGKTVGELESVVDAVITGLGLGEI